MKKAKEQRAGQQEETKSLRAERRAAERRAQPAARARRTDAERWNRFFIIGGVAAIVLLAVGLIGFGWYQTQIKPLSKTVLRVEDTKFSLAHLERRMRLALDQSPFFTQQDLLALPDSVLNQLEFEATLLQGAKELEITVTEEDVDAEIRERGNLADDVAPNLFAVEFREQVDDSHLKPDEYRQMLRATVAGQKVLNYFVFLSPGEEAQVSMRWIVTDSQEQADETVQRLEAGEDFAALAAEISIETTSSGEGGEVDWSPRGTFPNDAIEDFLFEDAEPGERSEIISSNNFFYIVELLERDESRKLDESQRQVVGNRGMVKWVDGLTLDIERDLTQEDAIRALNDIT